MYLISLLIFEGPIQPYEEAKMTLAKDHTCLLLVLLLFSKPSPGEKK